MTTVPSKPQLPSKMVERAIAAYWPFTNPAVYQQPESVCMHAALSAAGVQGLLAVLEAARWVTRWTPYTDLEQKHADLASLAAALAAVDGMDSNENGGGE